MKPEDITKIELEARRLRAQHLASLVRAAFTALRRRPSMTPVAGHTA